MDKEISIAVTIKSDLDKVWESWTQPQHIINWNFASAEWHCPSAVNNIQVGGKFSWRMEAKDGSMGFDFEGTYLNVLENKLLEYELGDKRPVKVEFKLAAEGVTLTETFTAEDENSAEAQRQGWLAILYNFKTYTEKL